MVHWPTHEDRDFKNAEVIRRVDVLLATGTCIECGAKGLPEVEDVPVDKAAVEAREKYLAKLAAAHTEYEAATRGSDKGGGS